MAFYQTIARHYDAIFPLQPTQVDFVHRHLPKSAVILDVGCATGSLALALAARHHQVTGIDLSVELLKRARQKAADAHCPVTFHQRDMTELDGQFETNHFDVITCMGNTLSHLPLKEVSRFFEASHRLLKKNGQLIFQIVNHDRFQKRNLSSLPTIDNKLIQFERTYSNFDGASPFTFHGRLTVKEEERSFEVAETLYPHTEAQLHHALTYAGFGNTQFFGNYQGAPAGDDHIPLIAVAGK